jgi:glycosyltransferase involved in cell wall biosynthesis
VRIGVEACCWSNRRGFGRYTRELVGRMVADFPQHQCVLVVDRQTARDSALPAGARVEVVATCEQPTRAAVADGARRPADLWRMAAAVARLRLDLFFFPAVYSYFPLLRRLPTVVTFHDAIPERDPELIFPTRRSRLLWRMKTWLALWQADRLLTVSEDARSQIAAAFRYPAAAVRVVPEGVNPCFRPLGDHGRVREVLARYRVPGGGPLLLYVGGISPHKNLQGLLRSLARVRRLCASPWHLALVGDHVDDRFHGCYEEVAALAAALSLERQITFTGYVPDEDLVALYNAATVLVQPSFNEGFGLPVAESLACGLPVAASRRGSLPEVIGPAGLLFDPCDHEEMAVTIARLLQDALLRQRLAAEGLRRAPRFSWAAAAAATVRLFEETAAAARTGMTG